MKKFLALLVIVFLANNAFAQECRKTCEKTCKKDSYTVVDGLIEAKLFHDNGAVAQTGYYTLENKLHGEWISYDLNGNKTAVAQYDNGEKVGTWLFYDGDTMKQVTYSNSKITEVKNWTSADVRVVNN